MPTDRPTDPSTRRKHARDKTKTDDAETEQQEQEQARAASRRSFFRDGGVARAVIIDTEPKVIQRIVAARGGAGGARGGGGAGGGGGGGWMYDSGTQVCCHAQGGAANNWAFGYHAHGATFTEACLEGVRRETERCGRGRGETVVRNRMGRERMHLRKGGVGEHRVRMSYVSCLAVGWVLRAFVRGRSN